MLKLGRDAHGDGEIVMPHPGNVHTGHGNDGFEILEGFRRFQEEDDTRLFIGTCEEICIPDPIEVVSDTESHASPAEAARTLAG